MPDAVLSSPRLPSHYLSVLRAGDRFVEVGAGEGAISALLAAQVGPTGKGIVLEGSGTAHARLKEGMARRRQDWVDCPAPGQPWALDGLALDGCRLLRLAAADPAAVLAGAGALLARFQPAVIIHCPGGRVPEGLLGVLARLSYRCYGPAVAAQDGAGAVELLALPLHATTSVPPVAAGTTRLPVLAAAAPQVRSAAAMLAEANALHAAGKKPESEALFRELVRLHPDHALGWSNLGIVLNGRAERAEAEECLRTAIRLAPERAATYTALGAVLREAGRREEARDMHATAVALDPAAWNGLYNYANTVAAIGARDDGTRQDGARWYARAGVLAPGEADIWHNLGLVLIGLGRGDEAIGCYQRALALSPANADIWGNLSKGLQEQNRLDDALAAINRGHDVRPDYIDLLYNRSLLLLLRGEYEVGWREYEWRWKCTRFTSPPLKQPKPRPLWQGESLAGRTLLVHAEQGLGDTIQFVRYLPKLCAGAKQVYVLVQSEVTDVIRLPDNARLLRPGEPYPEYDLYCPMLSLPHMLGTADDLLVGEIPYVRRDPAREAYWDVRLAAPDGARDGLRVGIVWAGNPSHTNDANRSMDAALLKPLLKIPGVRLFSVQVGPRGAELAAAGIADAFEDLAPELKSFADTSAALEALDLLIAVDTSTVHIAGAAGRPVWVLLPVAPDWRWLTGRDDTPWYPSVTLYRQKKRRDWAGVMDRVARDLRKLAGTRRKPRPGRTEAMRQLVARAEQIQPTADAALAEALWTAVSRLAPGDGRAWHALSAFAAHGGQPDRAVDLGQRAAALMPADSQLWSNMGVYERRRGDHARAILFQGRAARLGPLTPEMANNLASARHAAGRPDEAIAAGQAALALAPAMAQAWYNLALSQKDEGAVEAARLSLRRAQVARPPYVEATLHEAFALLLAGRLREGWDAYESRWLQPDAKQHQNFTVPQWDGEALDGRTILLHAEQGFGDSFQFLRYVPMVAARGGRVLLGVQPEIESLASRIPGVAQLVQSGPVPPIDTHCALLGLPRVFGTTLETIPAETPYLAPDPARVARWAERLGGLAGLRVGLVWAGRPTHGNDHNRSLALSALAPLAAVPGISWVALQKGPACAQMRGDAPALRPLDLETELVDFEETAAALANLDLLVTVDTSVAHLAGALGRPTFVLLPKAPDWRWMLDRPDTPWYPATRLFRQSRRGDWSDVLASIAAALAERAGALAPARPAKKKPARVKV